MVSKLNKMNKQDIYFQALLGLFAGACLSYCFQLNLVELQGNVVRSMQDGFITLVIKFLHFFMSKCLQYRYSSPLATQSWEMSMLFWFALTQSVSSMSDSS